MTIKAIIKLDRLNNVSFKGNAYKTAGATMVTSGGKSYRARNGDWGNGNYRWGGERGKHPII